MIDIKDLLKCYDVVLAKYLCDWNNKFVFIIM